MVATRPGLKRVLLLVDARHGLKVCVLCMLPLTLPQINPLHQPLFGQAGDVAFLEDLFGRKDHDSGGRTGHGSINDGGSEAATTPPVSAPTWPGAWPSWTTTFGPSWPPPAARRGWGRYARVSFDTRALLPTTHGGVVA